MICYRGLFLKDRQLYRICRTNFKTAFGVIIAKKTNIATRGTSLARVSRASSSRVVRVISIRTVSRGNWGATRSPSRSTLGSRTARSRCGSRTAALVVRRRWTRSSGATSSRATKTNGRCGMTSARVRLATCKAGWTSRRTSGQETAAEDGIVVAEDVDRRGGSDGSRCVSG